MKKVKKANALIKELFPDFEFLKKWNEYTLYYYDDPDRILITRKPNKTYKTRACFIIPFTFIPYCFWFGFPNVKNAIKQSFKGEWIVEQTSNEEIIKKVKEYFDGLDNKQ